MDKTITRLLWDDFDGFFKALQLIAAEEVQREVISTELLEWWLKMHNLINELPIHALPKDI